MHKATMCVLAGALLLVVGASLAFAGAGIDLDVRGGLEDWECNKTGTWCATCNHTIYCTTPGVHLCMCEEADEGDTCEDTEINCGVRMSCQSSPCFPPCSDTGECKRDHCGGSGNCNAP